MGPPPRRRGQRESPSGPPGMAEQDTQRRRRERYTPSPPPPPPGADIPPRRRRRDRTSTSSPPPPPDMQTLRRNEPTGVPPIHLRGGPMDGVPGSGVNVPFETPPPPPSFAGNIRYPGALPTTTHTLPNGPTSKLTCFSPFLTV